MNIPIKAAERPVPTSWRQRNAHRSQPRRQVAVFLGDPSCQQPRFVPRRLASSFFLRRLDMVSHPFDVRMLNVAVLSNVLPGPVALTAAALSSGGRRGPGRTS